MTLSRGNSHSVLHLFDILLIFCLALSGLLIYARYTQRVVEGWDSLAYLYAAERLADGETFDLCNHYNASIGPYFTLAGFNIRSKSPECLSLNYPPGFPLLLAGFYRVLPLDTTIFFVPAFFGAIGVLLVYCLGKLLFETRIALTAALLLMLTPAYLEFSTSLWSDVPVAILLLGGAVVLIWGYQRSSWISAGIVGIVAASLIGWAIFSRYAAIVFLVPLALFFCFRHTREQLFRLFSLRVFIITCLVIAIGVLFFNNVVYGGLLTTPYSKVNGWYPFPKFSWHYALEGSPVGGPSLTAMVQTLWENFSVLLLPAMVGLFSMPRAKRVLTAGNLVVHLGLYVFYAFPAEGINSRFIAPSLPFLALAISCGVWYSFTLLRRWIWIWRWIWLAMIFALILFPLPTVLRKLDDRNNAVGAYVQWVTDLAAHTESDAVILAYSANDSLFYHGQRMTMFYRRIPGRDPDDLRPSAETFETRLVSAVSDLLKMGYPVYYVVDSNPPLMNSLAILQNQFRLSPVLPTSALYRIERFGSSD